MSAITIEYRCPDCGSVNADRRLDAASAPGCGACDATLEVAGLEGLRRERMVRICPICTGTELYVQRDFNRRLGLALVIVAVLLALPTRGLSLLAMVAVDLILHRLLPGITICYRCGAIVRGARRNPGHSAFDMAIEEKHRAIRELETAERSGTPAEPAAAPDARTADRAPDGGP